MPTPTSQIYLASSSQSATGTTIGGRSLTAYASATASSAVSQSHANTNAVSLALAEANDVLAHDIELVNTAVNDIGAMNNIANLTNVMNMQETINSVNGCLGLDVGASDIATVLNYDNELGKKMYFPYYLYQLIQDNSSAIIYSKNHGGNGYADVLLPIINLKYGNETSDLFWIQQCNFSTDTLASHYANKLYLEVGQFSNLTGLTIGTIPDSLTKQFFLTESQNEYNMNKQYPSYFTDNSNSFVPLFKTYIWTNGLKTGFNIYMKDLLDTSKWIVIGSGIDIVSVVENPQFVINSPDPILLSLNEYTNNKCNIDLNELYKHVNSFGGWTTADFTWTYVNEFNINQMQCLDASGYDWAGKYVNECFIPGSNFDVTNMMFQIVKQLDNFPTLLPGYVVGVTYQNQNDYYFAFIQIENNPSADQYSNYSKYIFYQKSYNIKNLWESTGPSVTSIGDLSVQGGLTVKSPLNEYATIQSDTLNKITCFNEKVGINVQPFQVKGMLDIDNLSNSQVINLVQDFTSYQLATYTVINKLNK
jgi:hypothetical protein